MTRFWRWRLRRLGQRAERLAFSLPEYSAFQRDRSARVFGVPASKDAARRERQYKRWRKNERKIKIARAHSEPR
jgi:hypothetical protein